VLVYDTKSGMLRVVFYVKNPLKNCREIFRKMLAGFRYDSSLFLFLPFSSSIPWCCLRGKKMYENV